MALWTARELARLTDVPVPTVSTWINAGLIAPAQLGRGRGGHKIGLMGLIELLTIIELRAAGLAIKDIRKAVENLRRISGETRPLAKLTLVVFDNDVLWIDSDKLDEMPVSALRQPSQRAMIFPIGEKHNFFIQQLSGSDVSDVQYGETSLFDASLGGQR